MMATALRLFSISSGTRRVYRLLGNTIGQRKRVRSGPPSHYVETAKNLLELCERYDVIDRGDRVLEVGTGWVHWLATILRLFYDVEVTLFDIWDNRQLTAYKSYCAKLQQSIGNMFEIKPAQREGVNRVFNTVLAANAFSEIYRDLGFQYVVDPSGTLTEFGDGSFAAIVSVNVLEHVEAGIVAQFIRDSYRVLRPGGFSIHQIDLSDHLANYDHGVSRKNYYRFPDRVWEHCFENRVQYFNRVQRPEWIDLFAKQGFELVRQDSVFGDVGDVVGTGRFAHLSKRDRECMVLEVVHRKPRALGISRV